MALFPAVSFSTWFSVDRRWKFWRDPTHHVASYSTVVISPKLWCCQTAADFVLIDVLEKDLPALGRQRLSLVSRIIPSTQISYWYDPVDESNVTILGINKKMLLVAERVVTTRPAAGTTGTKVEHQQSQSTINIIDYCEKPIVVCRRFPLHYFSPISCVLPHLSKTSLLGIAHEAE